jgi:adenylylsulfate kinase
METKRRSLVKSLSWRVWATFITMIVSFAITREVAFAVEIGLLDTTIKLFLYFAHERIWVRIPYGLTREAESDYQI